MSLPRESSMVTKALLWSVLLFGASLSSAEVTIELKDHVDFLFNETACPSGCSCNDTLKSIYCDSKGYRSHFATFIEELSPSVENLTVIKAWFPNIPTSMSKFGNLQYLSFPECKIETINETAFSNMSLLTELNLRGNLIHSLDENVFGDLTGLRVLDLSYNVLDRLPEKIFQSLISLQVLNVRNNRIQYFASRTFHDLHDLFYLDLSFNQLHFLETNSLRDSTELEILLLESNSLRSLNKDMLVNLTKLRVIELENNPWVCSCSLLWLSVELNSPSFSRIYENPHRIKCHSPLKLKGQQVRTIAQAHMECVEPDIMSATESQSVIYQDHTVLKCNVSGYPKPSVYWVTPRGEVIAHESQREWIHQHTDPVKSYRGLPTFYEARATPLEDGSLFLSNFRRYFAGDYHCFAVNPVGHVNSSMTISIISLFPDIQRMTYIIGLGGTGVAVILGIIGGCFRLLIDYIYYKREPETEMTEDDVKSSISSSFNSISPAHSPKRWPRRSPGGSPTKSFAYNTDEEYDSDEGREKDTFANDLKDMKETMDEMHVRLRRGMQHTTEKMRSRMSKQALQLRESTAHYMHTLRDSSAHTAHRMRAGMQLSLEQMKSGVQSIKEFCGAGDMSHTISTVSVSTDVDSQEMTTVVKNITYV